MDFKKFVSDVSTSFNRAVQYTEEKLGTSDRTEYDAAFESLCQRADRLTDACTKIVAACEAYLQPNPALRVESYVSDKLQSITQKKREIVLPSEDLAAVMAQAANELGPATSYGDALLKTSDLHRNLASYEKDLSADVETNSLVLLRQFLENESKTIQKERNLLNAKRLDLDAAKNKLKKAKASASVNQPQANEPLENDVEACQVAFDRQMETTRLLLEGVAAAYKVHLGALLNLIRAEKDYHSKCAESLNTAWQALSQARVEANMNN